MALIDFAVVNISISNANGPQGPGLKTPIIAAYHNHYADRVRLYSTGSMLQQMVTDGFSVNEPAYKAAQKVCGALAKPANCCIGRRALPPFQTLKLTCLDGTVNDAYDFQVVGSDGKTTTVHYQNVGDPGTAESPTTTATVVKGSTALTLSASLSLAAGGVVQFGDPIAGVPSAVPAQPGIYYAIASGSVTSYVLSAAYQGPSAALTNLNYLAPLSVTGTTVLGSATVATSATSVGQVAVGDSVQFNSQLNTFYTVAAVTSAHIVLTTPFSGAGTSGDYITNVCQSGQAATAITAALEAITGYLGFVGTVSKSGSVITISRTDGNLTDITGWLANGFASLSLQDTTADPGIATDLAAMQSANGGAWYAVILDSNSQAELAAAAAWVEATGVGGKILAGNNSDVGNTTTPAPTPADVFSQLQTLAYKRTIIQQNNQELLSYGGASIVSYFLSQLPGSYNPAFKAEPGVPADSDTTLPEGEALILNTMTASAPGPGGKNGNYYKSQGGQPYFFPGCAPGGQFFDLTIGIDDLTIAMQVAVIAYLAGLPKVPFDDFGLQGLGAVVRGVLVSRSAPPYGLILPDGQDPLRPISVIVPPASSYTSAQRAARVATGILWSAGLQGAIDGAVISGTLNP